jgi:hypothetical protein
MNLDTAKAGAKHVLLFKNRPQEIGMSLAVAKTTMMNEKLSQKIVIYLF